MRVARYACLRVQPRLPVDRRQHLATTTAAVSTPLLSVRSPAVRCAVRSHSDWCPSCSGIPAHGVLKNKPRLLVRYCGSRPQVQPSRHVDTQQPMRTMWMTMEDCEQHARKRMAVTQPSDETSQHVTKRTKQRGAVRYCSRAENERL